MLAGPTSLLQSPCSTISSGQIRFARARMTCERGSHPRFVSVLRSPPCRVQFSVTFAPCKTVCLLSFLVTRALSEDAFETPFSSVEELLQRPILEHTDSLSLRWKEGVKRQYIVGMSYHRYWELWNRAIWVCCLREDLRPYAARVGTGIALTGKLLSLPTLSRHG